MIAPKPHSKRLLKDTNYTTHRYLCHDFAIDNRLIGLIGPRGSGKTTLMLQYIQEKIQDISTGIYVSLDHIHFANNRLYNFVNQLYETEGIRVYFLDEVHKYHTWNQELKNIYDSFPDIKIVFSGSSSLDLVKGHYDLSRRGILFYLYGMSFREYLSFILHSNFPSLTFEEILQQKAGRIDEIASIPKLRGHFTDYLLKGYYPFVFEDPINYHQRIENVIEKIIHEDIPNFYNLNTQNLLSFKKILAYLATIPPGNVSINQISKHIGLDNKTIANFIEILSDTCLIRRIPINKSGSALLKPTERSFIVKDDILYGEKGVIPLYLFGFLY